MSFAARACEALKVLSVTLNVRRYSSLLSSAGAVEECEGVVVVEGREGIADRDWVVGGCEGVADMDMDVGGGVAGWDVEWCGVEGGGVEG